MHFLSECVLVVFFFLSDLAVKLTSMVIPAATLGALGYGYMWWKVLLIIDILAFFP